MKIFRLFPIIMAIGKLYVSIKWLDVEPAELYLNSVSCHNYGKIEEDSNFQNDIVSSFFRAAL